MRREGGFSVNIHTGEQPTSGYMVSDLRGERSKPLRHLTGKDIQDYAMQKGAKRLSGPHRYLGGWADRDVSPHTAYLDRSTHYPETDWGKSKAYVRMVANAQKSAYHVGQDAIIPNPAIPQDKPRDLGKIMRRMQGQNVA